LPHKLNGNRAACCDTRPAHPSTTPYTSVIEKESLPELSDLFQLGRKIWSFLELVEKPEKMCGYAVDRSAFFLLGALSIVWRVVAISGRTSTMASRLAVGLKLSAA